MEKIARKFRFFAESEAADKAFYRSLTPNSGWRFSFKSTPRRARMNLTKDLKEFVALLNAANVKYLPAGGH